ncbi:MAG: AAA family ATPase, partial [Anaerolineae bacterium]|nr:AAA family ATPase [Anaerolineae bacterium]
MFVAISSQTSEQSVGICLTLLGGFSIWLGAQEISEADFSRRKARSLLKLIALQPAYRLSRDQAMDLLWPDLAPRGAAAQLYKALHYIRQAFAAAQPSYPPEAVLDLHNEILTLDAPGGVHTDVEAFETLAQEATGNRDLVLLQRAVASYGGDLLPADLYEEWTLERREALRERFMDLLVRLGEVYLASQHLPEAAEAFRRALARDPAHEAAHRGLMRAFAFQGYHTRALRQYRLCQDALARELDVAPSEETVRLYEEIRQGKLQPLQVATSSSVTEPAGLTLLVGRQNETQVVNDLLNHLGRGRGAVLSLEGSAGIGKTRMAQEILGLGRRRGYLVLMGSAHEQEGCSPYTPIIDALRMALVTSQADADLIPAELAAAIPELAPVKPPAPNPDRVAAQAILFAGVLRFLSARARAMPLVLILDDLHAADEASLQLFHYLARHTSDRPLLLIGAWRSQEVGAGPDLRTLVASLERKGLARHLLLTPLSESEHRALLDLTLGQGNVDIRLAAEVYRLSAGNPLFAQEIVRQLAAAGEVVKGRSGWRLTGSPRRVPIPPSLQLLLAPRLAHLSPTTRHLLNVATVAGQEVPFSVLQATAGTASETLLVGLDEAIASRLLEESGMTYRFVHPLFREAIYQQMTQARRQELHGQVARALEAMYQDDPT